MNKNIPILHVDGSLTEYLDQKGILHRVAGIGGYLVQNGKIIDKFYKVLKNIPYLHHHEDYAIIEGLKWIREKRIKAIKIKSDSLPSVMLFTHKKKNVTKTDKFFLMQYLAIEMDLDYVSLDYHGRSTDDLAHNLSRSYLKELPKGIVRLHAENRRKKFNYEILAVASEKCDFEVRQFLYNGMLEAFKKYQN